MHLLQFSKCRKPYPDFSIISMSYAFPVPRGGLSSQMFLLLVFVMIRRWWFMLAILVLFLFLCWLVLTVSKVTFTFLEPSRILLLCFRNLVPRVACHERFDVLESCCLSLILLATICPNQTGGLEIKVC